MSISTEAGRTRLPLTILMRKQFLVPEMLRLPNSKQRATGQVGWNTILAHTFISF